MQHRVGQTDQELGADTVPLGLNKTFTFYTGFWNQVWRNNILSFSFFLFVEDERLLMIGDLTDDEALITA